MKNGKFIAFSDIPIRWFNDVDISFSDGDFLSSYVKIGSKVSETKFGDDFKEIFKIDTPHEYRTVYAQKSQDHNKFQHNELTHKNYYQI